MYVAEELDKPRVQQMSELIADPSNLNIFLRSKTFQDHCQLEDKWFKTKFSKEPFSPELQNLMRKPKVDQSKRKLDLPPLNNLLPKNLDILPENPQYASTPQLVKQWADTDLWYLKDDQFHMPKALVNLKLYTNDCLFGRTTEARVFIEVWTKVLSEVLREYGYMASMANLESYMSIYHDNFNIEFKGYNDTLPIYIEETLKRMKAFNPADHEEEFSQVKEKLMQEWFNFYLEQSFRQGYANFENIVISAAIEKKVLRNILESFTFEEFVRVSKEWFKTGRFVWFVHGNIDKDVAVSLVERARETLNLKPVGREDLADVRCIAIPPNSHYLLEIPLEDRTNENSCLISYFEAGVEGMDLRKKLIHRVVM